MRVDRLSPGRGTPCCQLCFRSALLVLRTQRGAVLATVCEHHLYELEDAVIEAKAALASAP